MKKPLLTIFALLSVFAFYGCPNDDVVKPDPCSRKPVKTKIVFRESVRDSLVVTDTFRPVKTIVVSAEGDSATEWHWDIEDGSYTQDKRSFAGVFQETGPFRFKLIAKRITNSECFPEDDGWDTVSKVLFGTTKRAFYGLYRGCNLENPTDTFNVRIWHDTVPGCDACIRMIGINKECGADSINLYSVFNISGGYLGFQFYCHYFGDGCKTPWGFVLLDRETNELVVDYTTADSDEYENRKQHRFVGVKICEY